MSKLRELTKKHDHEATQQATATGLYDDRPSDAFDN
jgi:hypothetical protein